MYSEDRRVVVTGLGAITPVGNTPEEFWQGLLAGRSGIDPGERAGGAFAAAAARGTKTSVTPRSRKSSRPRRASVTAAVYRIDA